MTLSFILDLLRQTPATSKRLDGMVEGGRAGRKPPAKPALRESRDQFHPICLSVTQPCRLVGLAYLSCIFMIIFPHINLIPNLFTGPTAYLIYPRVFTYLHLPSLLIDRPLSTNSTNNLVSSQFYSLRFCFVDHDTIFTNFDEIILEETNIRSIEH